MEIDSFKYLVTDLYCLMNILNDGILNILNFNINHSCLKYVTSFWTAIVASQLHQHFPGEKQ